MQTAPTRLRGTTAAAALAVSLVACGPADQPEPQALCDPVDELIAIAADLGTDPDEITDDYRRLADRYEQIANELDDPEAAAHAQRLAQVTTQAADEIDAIDPRDEIDHFTDVSDAVAEMSTTINANLPIGLDPTAMDQIERQCDPDFSDLTPSG
jgi:hypothetical protein